MIPSRMSQMTALGADWWNDSGVPAELSEAVALGAVGGTSNPVIVAQAVKAQPALCHPIIDRLAAEHPHDTEDDIAWKLIHTLALDAASRLMPVHAATRGEKGFLSVQVSPKYYPSKELMVEQATRLAALAPNIAIKAPATATGLAALEEMTARGIRINATVSFTVPQAIAVAEAIERGLKRARAAGRNADAIRPYITLMIGRVDDHLKRVAEREKIETSPGILDWAGIAVFKNAHRIFQRRGLPGTLLAAAYRHEGHWSQIIGREVLQTVPYTWWTKFNVATATPTLTLDQPVDDRIVAELRAKFPDFVRAHDENGMPAEAFLGYGATVHTLNQFLGGYADLLASVRARILPI
ncbi:transaldolase family protein [Horticoccus sp. 23ND18S-11]|uniref:transaldolase family protein n=1 Tax=Horticoccus sp. 23ND18S-11 TaxID=3391832 RepID=UPI0039C95506